MEDIVIVSAARTAVGKFGGSLAKIAAPDLGAAVIREALARAKVDPALVGEVIMGQVLAAGAGPLQARAQQAQAARDASEAAAAQRQQEFAAADAKYDAISGKNSEGLLARAIQLMVDNDSRDDVITLYREAERTRSNEDKEIVAQIEQLTRQLGKAEADMGQIRTQIRDLDGRRDQLAVAAALLDAAGVEQVAEEFPAGRRLVAADAELLGDELQFRIGNWQREE